MTIQAQVVLIDLLEIAIDEYTGVNETNIMLDIKVGKKDATDGGIEYFQAFVVTPEDTDYWLENHTDFYPGRGHYLVEKIDRETLHRVANHLTEKINTTQGETWDEVSCKLSWYAFGEFERYNRM